MVHDTTSFGIVGCLFRCCHCPCLVYHSTQTTKCPKGGYLVGFGRRYRIFLWKFFAGTWDRLLIAIQLLEYYGIFYRFFWRIGNGLWNTQLVLARQRTSL